MSRLQFATQAEAQSCADSIHSRMIASVPSYAASVAAGQTTAWAVPYQDRDSEGNVIGTEWYVSAKQRCWPVLTAEEQGAAE